MSQLHPAATTIPKPLTGNPEDALLHSVLQQLDKSQWWSRAQLEQGCLPQLQRLLQHAKTHSPFYQQRLRQIDVSSANLENYVEIPVLNRAQLQAINATIDADSLPPDHGAPKETMTSGSTGAPVRIRGTGVTALLWQAFNLREHMWQQRDPHQTACSIRWRSDSIGKSAAGIALPDWGAPINQFYKTGPSYYLNSAVDVAQQKLWLENIRPAYLMSHPSNVAALAELFRREGSDLPSLLEIRKVGESISLELRKLVRDVFSASLTDFYSSQELGYIALQCPQHEHYHVQTESVLVEVLREDGTPCDVHEIGRLVITSLRNYATPLLRYDIGDYGALGEPCSCGRGLPVLHSINGRVRNMLQLPDGNRRWPNFGFQKMMDIAELRQFQLVQWQPDAIELKLVVAASPLSPVQEANLQRVLCESLGYPFHITISYHAALPRSAGGKFEDFISLISPA